MSVKNEVLLSEESIKEAIANTPTMGGAAKYLKVDWRTFKKEAEKYGLYTVGKRTSSKYDIKDILSGMHPQYPTSKLSVRLVKEGIKKYMCEECNIVDYNGKPITLELNHVNGDNSDHSLDNLQLLCPNCHSQTPTFRNKRGKNKKG